MLRTDDYQRNSIIILHVCLEKWYLYTSLEISDKWAFYGPFFSNKIISKSWFSTLRTQLWKLLDSEVHPPADARDSIWLF